MHAATVITFKGSVGRKVHRTDFGPSVDEILADDQCIAAFLDLVDNDTVRAVAGYWIDAVRAAGGLPDREAFAPSKILPWIQNFAFLRADSDQDWLITYCGVTIAEYFSTDMTGALISTIADPQTHKVWKYNTTRMNTEQRAVLEHYSMSFADRPHLWVWDLDVPLSPDKKTGQDQCAALSSCRTLVRC